MPLVARPQQLLTLLTMSLVFRRLVPPTMVPSQLYSVDIDGSAVLFREAIITLWMFTD